MHRSPREVGRAHLGAVESGDPVAMAADYATNAVLIRGDETYCGRTAIADYFATVPDRLGSARVVFDALEVVGDQVTFVWHLEGGSVAASGTDVCEVADGLIVRQVVHLVSTDF